MAVKDMYQRLKAGETISVRAQWGKEFSIEPAYWEGIVLGYTVVDNGSPVRGHTGMILERAEVEDWAAQLEEVAK